MRELSSSAREPVMLISLMAPSRAYPPSHTTAEERTTGSAIGPPPFRRRRAVAAGQARQPLLIGRLGRVLHLVLVGAVAGRAVELALQDGDGLGHLLLHLPKDRQKLLLTHACASRGSSRRTGAGCCRRRSGRTGARRW